MALKILDVGQCGMDGPRLKRLLQERLSATVVQASTPADAHAKLKSDEYQIVLVNRVLAADGSSGLELIAELVEVPSHPPIMLVSDFADAQEEAVKLGAVQGFGKAVLDSPEILDLIKSAAGA